jgi:hypothetical protein
MVAVPIRSANLPPDTTEVLPAATDGGYLASVARTLTEQVRQLPQTVDELTRDFGLTFYDQMALDPHISALERVLTTAVLNQGVQYDIPTPRTDRRYDQAARIQAFVAQVFDALPVALETRLFELIPRARRHGHCLTEAVWTTRKMLRNAGPQRVYADLKPKPLGVYAFVQDAYGNTLGIVRVGAGSRLPGPGPATLAEGMVNGQPLYPMAQFPTLTWNAQNCDPRGQSAYRAIFGAWWKKRQTEPGLLAYLARFGQPSLKIILPPGVADKVTVNGVEVETRTLYKQTGEDYQAGGVSVWPNGTVAELDEATGDGAAYLAAETLWNKEIAVGLTGQTLATGEGEHRSGTDSRTHQDMIGLLVMYLRSWVGDWVSRQLIAPLIVANFGAAALPLAPRADLGRVSPEDRNALLQAFAQLAGPGQYWDATKVPPDIGAQLDAMAGIPQRQTTAIGPDGTPADTPPTNPNPPTADTPPPQPA